MGMTPSGDIRGKRGDKRPTIEATHLGPPGGSEWHPMPMDEDGGNGPPARVEKSPHFTPTEFASAAKFFGTVKGELFRNDPHRFFEEVNTLFSNAASKYRKIRVAAAPFTPNIIVAGVVELLRQDLSEFVRNGSYANAEKYKCPAGAVIARCNDTVAAVSLAERAAPEHWRLEEGLLNRLALAARILNPPAHRKLYERAETHTNRKTGANRNRPPTAEAWEDAGLLSLVGQELTQHCLATGKNIQTVVELTHKISLSFNEQSKLFLGKQFDLLDAHSLAKFIHRAAIAEQKKQEEQRLQEQKAQAQNQFNLFD